MAMSDEELRRRILTEMSVAVIGTELHMDYELTNTILDHAPVGVTSDMIKERMAHYWLKRELEDRQLSWWGKLRFWWRLWRGCR